MKKMLNFEKKETWYFVDGKRITVIHDNIRGDVSDISGDVTGISGDVTDISGDVDACEIMSAERKKGIEIKDLIK